MPSRILILAAAFIFTCGFLSFGKDQLPHYTITLSQGPQRVFEPPALPDISGYTRAALKQKFERVNRQPAQISLGLMREHYGFLPTQSEHTQYAQMQNAGDARAIVIEKGFADLPMIEAALNNANALERTAEGYLLKVPVFVKAGATLGITGPEQNLYLAQSSGAFLSSRGRVFILESQVIGWDDFENTPAFYKDAQSFRPFLVFWDQSESFIAGATLSHLGYNAAKAYGLTLSTNGGVMNKNPQSLWPKAQIIDSRIEDLYYGFYTYEAENTALVNNLFINNVIYGIDPHDRSRNLIIARNETTGSKAKHGIIISRDVHSSWIFGNRSHGNAGAGIMIERNSTKNVIAHNVVYNNQDGLSFYESSDNVSFSNIIRENAKNGLRIRNSQRLDFYDETIIGNGRYGLEAYSAVLDAAQGRDLEKDPYEPITGLRLEDSKFDLNQSAQIRFENVQRASMRRIGAPRVAGGFLKGDLADESLKLYDVLQGSQMVQIEQREAP